MAALSVVNRLPKALGELKLGGEGARPAEADDGSVWVSSAEEVPQDNGAPGWECSILRADTSKGCDKQVGVLAIQPLSTGLDSQTYLEFPANLLGQDFGRRLERLVTWHRKHRPARVQRADRKCELHHRPDCPAGCTGPCPPQPTPNNHHGTAQFHLQGSARSRRAAARIVARARARNTPILLPFKRQPCPDLGAQTVNLGPTVSSLSAARYNAHSQHEWSQVLVGNFIEERERAVGAPEMNFTPWGGENQAVGSKAGPHDPTWAAATSGSSGPGSNSATASRVSHSYARGTLRPDSHDTRYLTATAVDVPLQPDAQSMGAEGYRLRRTGWPPEKQELDSQAAPAGAYRRPRAGGGGGPTPGTTAAGDPWHGRVEALEAERLAQKHVTIGQHLQWPAPASASSARAGAVQVSATA
eukprot:COSAG02_NODE_5902_length_3942_cov_10.008314_4_plen_415_part_00